MSSGKGTVPPRPSQWAWDLVFVTLIPAVFAFVLKIREQNAEMSNAEYRKYKLDQVHAERAPKKISSDRNTIMARNARGERVAIVQDAARFDVGGPAQEEYDQGDVYPDEQEEDA